MDLLALFFFFFLLKHDSHCIVEMLNPVELVFICIELHWQLMSDGSVESLFGANRVIHLCRPRKRGPPSRLVEPCTRCWIYLLTWSLDKVQPPCFHTLDS